MTDPNTKHYLAVPASGQGRGVLVLHPWWGLNDFMLGFCDRLAQAGFVALAPDLFSGKVARTIDEAEQLIADVDQQARIPALILTAAAELGKRSAAPERGFGVVGFSFGAYWSLWLAQEKPETIRAITLFYGTDGGGGDFGQSKAAFLGHFAAEDPYEPAEGIEALESNLKGAHRPTTFYTYPGTGHWFFEKDREDAYNPQAAQLAWERTTAFLSEQLASA